MGRKREKPYFSRHVPASISKRRRSFERPPEKDDEINHQPTAKPPPQPALVVMGLPADCSVLDLKSRFEIYGSISRIRIVRDGVGSVTYRTAESAEAAIAASLDPSVGITIESRKLEVMWGTDPLAQWREGVAGSGAGKDKPAASLSASSKLLRAETPLRRYGRGSKLASAMVNPRRDDAASSMADAAFNGRKIVAYDDIL